MEQGTGNDELRNHAGFFVLYSCVFIVHCDSDVLDEERNQ